MATVQLSYNEYGKNNTVRPLLMLHGLLGDKSNWQSIAKKLAKTQWVMTIDLRNHGESEHSDEMSYALMANDVWALADQIGCLSIALMGHSMGGKVAMTMALSQPSRVEQLVVVDIAPKDYPLHHLSLLNALLQLPLAQLNSRREADEQLSSVVSDPLTRGFLLKNLKRNPQTSGYYWQCHLEAISRQYLKLAHFSATGQGLMTVDFIRGALSHYIEDEDIALITSFFPNMMLHTIEDSGHMPHVEQADEFFKCLYGRFG